MDVFGRESTTFTTHTSEYNTLSGDDDVGAPTPDLRAPLLAIPAPTHDVLAR